jgi:hypothetical protein
VVISVTETQVNPITLIIELRMAGPRLPNEVRDAVQFFLAFGCQPFQAFGVVEQTRFRLIRGEIDEFCQDGTSR